MNLPAWVPAELQDQVQVAAPLAELTTVKVGGPADILFTPVNQSALRTFIKVKPTGVPITMLGAGSNVVIRDGGIAGVVVNLTDQMSEVEVIGDGILTAAGGATCGKVARAARAASLTGIEFFAGIPGSVGGAITMNAGAYGDETFDRLVSVDILLPDGSVHTLKKDEIPFQYRRSELPQDAIVVGATWHLPSGDPNKIKARMREVNQNRRTSQPLHMPSSGSWFKNPTLPDGTRGNAWRVVDEAGCRGWRENDAQVSEQHCNFFVNLGQATATDLLRLSERVEQAVAEKLGIVLEREARFIGREPQED